MNGVGAGGGFTARGCAVIVVALVRTTVFPITLTPVRATPLSIER